MAGIVTNAYFYIHGENELQLSTVLKTAEGVMRFMESHQEGVVLYSDYAQSDRKKWQEICHDNALLEAASSHVVVCPITAAILVRLSCSLDGVVGLDGKPLTSPTARQPNADSDRHSVSISPRTTVVMPDQPPEMQADKDLQRVLREAPDVTSEMIQAGVLTLADFRQNWHRLPVETAEKIGITFYRLVTRDLLPNIDKLDFLGAAQTCQKLANAIPPWCDTLSPFLPHIGRRAQNVLGREGVESPSQLAALSTTTLISWRNAGITTLKDIAKALGIFTENALTPFAILREDNNRPLEAGTAQLSQASGASEPDSSMHMTLPDITEIKGGSLVGIVLDGLSAMLDAAKALVEKETDRAKYVREIDVLMKRTQGNTLEGISEGYDVTRERIRQIETSGQNDMPSTTLVLLGLIDDHLKHLQQIPQSPDVIDHWTQVNQRVTDLLSLSKELHAIASGKECDAKTLAVWSELLIVSPKQLEKVDTRNLLKVLSLPLWRSNISMAVTPIFPSGFFTLSLGSRPEMPNTFLLAPLPEGTNERAESHFITHTLVPILDGQTIETANQQIATQLSLRDWPHTPAALLGECLTLHWMIRDGTALKRIETDPVAKQERKRFMELLRQSSRPLHDADEIFASIRPDDFEHPRPKAIVFNWVTSIQDNYLASGDEDYPVRIGNSMIGTMRHMRAIGITNQKAAAIADFIEQTLTENPDRQFGVTQLFQRLRQNGYLKGLSWPSNWDHPGVKPRRFPNMLNIILYYQRPSNVRNMGRFQWTYGPWTDEPDTSGRTEIYDFYRDLFLREHRPLTGREMLAALRQERDLNGSNQTQINETNGVIKLYGRGKNAVYWHEELGDINDTDHNTGSPSDHSISDKQEQEKLGQQEPEGFQETEQATSSQKSEHPLKVTGSLDKKFLYKSEVIAAVDAIIQATGRTMKVREIKEKLKAEYGKAPNQINSNEPLMVLQGSGEDAMLWTRSLNKESDADIKALQEDALAWINQRNEPLPVTRLMTLLPRHQEMLTRHSTMVWTAWLAQHQEMKIVPIRSRLYIFRDTNS